MQEVFPYDAVAYPGSPDAESHPRRLAGIASLLGMSPAAVAHCRVLELGCAAGRGLLPMAQEFPESEFVGVDIAGEQISEAASLANSLGLRNIEFRHGSIDEIDATWGQFDYILCLGVLTWVEPKTQRHIFETLRQNLTANGVGVVGYNVFPGWHLRSLTRDVMRFFTRAVDDPQAKIPQARAVLDLLAEMTPQESPHGQAFRTDRDYLSNSFDDYLYHDFLTDENHPIYFHDFYSNLIQHDLQYLGETNFVRNGFATGTPAAQAFFQQLSFAERCQFLDFLRNESYRKSLVCRRGTGIDVKGAAARMKGLRVALRELPKPAEFDVTDSDPLTISYSAGNLQAAAPFGKAALRHLIEIYPRTITIAELHRAAQGILRSSDGGDRWARTCDEDQLATAMLSSLYAGLVHACLEPPVYCDSLSLKPMVTPLTRLLASRAMDATTPRGLDTVNQCHEIVSLNRMTTFLLAHLDGTRSQPDLVAIVGAAIGSGKLQADLATATLEEQVARSCAEICEFRFLVG